MRASHPKGWGAGRMPKEVTMLTLTNSFHNTEATIRANVDDTVSRSTLRRVRKQLCGITGCTCGREDGTRHSRYRLESQGLDADSPVLVIDTRTEVL